MSIKLNHTIVGCRDRQVSVEFWTDILGATVGAPLGPFLPVTVDNEITLDFANVGPEVAEIQPQHYAFLVSDDVFDAAYDKIKRYRLDHWADPRKQGVNQINTNDGGRGVYFADPSGHFLELITVPYGGWQR